MHETRRASRQRNKPTGGKPVTQKHGGGQNVPDAPPSQTAVAIQYSPTDAFSAPTVVASGRGWVAEKILEIAFAHGVKVREDADLAEILAAVDLDNDIPVEAFVAVAEILRYVYAANGTHPPEFPES